MEEEGDPFYVPEKRIRTISHYATTTQTESEIFTATYPVRLSNIAIELDMQTNSGSSPNPTCWYAVVIQRDGETLYDMDISDGGEFFKPEDDCLMCGVEKRSIGSGGPQVGGIVRAAKKVHDLWLKVGDVIKLISKANDINAILVEGLAIAEMFL